MIDDDFDFDQPVTRIAANDTATVMQGKKILAAAQDYLDTMSGKEHAFLQQHLLKLAEQDAYFQVLAEQLNQAEDAKIANDALNLLHFWQLINDCDDVNTFNLLEVIQTEFFQNEVLQTLDDFTETGAANVEQRRAVIQEAFALYQHGFYAGCVPLLYAQLEGLLTDVLVAQGFLQQQQTKFVDVYKIVPGLKGNEIKSLWHKAKIATEMNAYFAELAAYKMDSSSTVSMTRHNILHGTEVSHFNQARCFILFLWLFSVLSFMRSIRS